MQQSLTRRLRRSSLRWVAAFGVTAALALPPIPAAAQLGDVTSSGASTPANCTIQLSVANPNPGDQEIPHTLIMSGTAVDTTAASGAGIAQVQVFLGNRDQGGAFIGAATFVDNPADATKSTRTDRVGTADAPGAWSITSVIPANISGGQSVFVYGTSSVSGQAAFVSIPVVVGEALQGSVSNQAGTFCPTLVAPTPTNPPAAPAAPTPALAQPAPAPPQPVPSQLAPPPAAPTPQPPAPAAVAAPQPPAPAPAPPAPVSPPVAAPAPLAAQLSISSPLSPPLTFNTNMLSAAAGAQVTLTYTNDSPIDHNWHVFNGPDSSSGTLALTTTSKLTPDCTLAGSTTCKWVAGLVEPPKKRPK